MFRTFSYACTVLYRRFTQYTSARLNQLGSVSVRCFSSSMWANTPAVPKVS